MSLGEENHTTVLDGRALFERLFPVYAGLLVFIFLPLDLAFRLKSFRLSMTTGDIAVNTAAMSLLLMLIAAAAALSMVIVASLARLLSGSRAYGWVYLASTLLVLLICGRSFFYYFKDWVLETFSYWLPNIWDFAAFVAFAALVIFRREKFQRLLHVFAAAAKTPLIVFAIVSFCMVGWRVVTADTRLRTSGPEQTPAATKKQPNIILVTLDALPAEEMSLYGYRLPTTPNLDAFAQECSVFKNTISASNWTKPSIGSLFTGKYPMRHRLITQGHYHTNTNPRPEESLSALLSKSGYRQVALVSNWGYAHPYVNGLAPFFDEKPLDYIAWRNIPLDKRISLLCFSKGLPVAHRFRIEALDWLGQIIVDREVNSRKISTLNNFRISFVDVIDPFFPPELVFKDAEKYLSDQRVNSDSRPLFIWLHVLVPHEPYLPPSPFRGTFLKGDDLSDYESQHRYLGREYEAREQPAVDRLRLRYDENLLYADAAFGDFLRFLRSTRRLDDSIVIVTADHGESFSHGKTAHGGKWLYNSLVHIPLMIHVPYQQTGKLISGVMSQVDIAPTILDLVGKQVPSWMDGVSLKQALMGESVPSRPVFTMNFPGNRTSGEITTGSMAVVEGNYKFIRSVEDGPKELYDNRNDPGEVKNLVQILPAKADHLDKLLSGYVLSPR